MTATYGDHADLDKVGRDLHWLMTCFAEVLSEAGDAELAARLPWIGRMDDDGDVNGRDAQAFSIAFQLLNLVEENAAAQGRRETEERYGPTDERGLWGQTLDDLRGQGVTDQDLAAVLPTISVEPVLTAHPTEAKRATVLEHYRELYLLLLKRENPIWTSRERAALRDDIKTVLERLWRTGDIFLEKPDVPSELRNVIYYLRRVFPAVLPELDRRLQAAWRITGGDPAIIADPAALPRLCFGTWVGGDRDGHPLVTAEVTDHALNELRGNALALLQDQLRTLVARLSLSDQLQTPPPALLARIDELRTVLGERGEAAVARNPHEPWRQFVNLMVARLPGDGAPGIAAYRRASELADDLALLDTSLRAVGANRIAESDVVPVRRSLQTFGFHLAVLDVRQNSAVHDRAVAQLLAAGGIAEHDFASWDEATRVAFLTEELRSPRPFARPDTPLGPDADAVIASYRVLVDHLRRHGPEGLGALIVSMTRSLSDLLVVHLFAREVGLLIETPDGLGCPLDVVPLFETIPDLEHAPDILRAALEHPVMRRGLEAQRLVRERDDLVQQVMVGYSDSNKDGGICASLWSLYRAQTELAAIGREEGVRVRFFHGRGGTISRGAGPIRRFVRALPPPALAGDLRLTEQGEAIGQKYANLGTATYNLELLLAGVTGAAARQPRAGTNSYPLESTLDRLAERSRRVYTDLIETDGFMAFFSQATPIDAIESSRIGSRPARRTGRRTLADLRAIPWVFSWGQARFYLSGWYGAGTGLETISREDPEAWDAIKAGYRDWPPLHYLVSNVATSVLTADPEIMAAYAALVDEPLIRDRLLDLIHAEYDRTRAMVEQIYGGPLAERRPQIARTLELRQEGLRRLHAQQIGLLRRWREARSLGDADVSDALLGQVLLNVNAIASGLRTTG